MPALNKMNTNIDKLTKCCVCQGFLIFLPFSSIAIVIVFVAIFCKWKKGIYAFILASVVLFVSFPPSLLPPCVFATLKAADR